MQFWMQHHFYMVLIYNIFNIRIKMEIRMMDILASTKYENHRNFWDIFDDNKYEIINY